MMIRAAILRAASLFGGTGAPIAQSWRPSARTLLYRRIAFCRLSATRRALEILEDLPIANRRYSRLKICATGWAILGLAALCALPLRAAPPIRFRDVTAASGIHFIHTDGSSGRRYIVETVASGLGLIDFDGDGYLDILFLNGTPLPGTPKPPRMPTSALYHNNRDGTFTDVTAGSGLDIPGYALGCAVADYDNDGREDILITYYEG